MKRPDRFTPADAQEIARLLGCYPLSAEQESKLIDQLSANYAEVWSEGHHEGRLDRMTGGVDPPYRNPYR